MVGRTFLRYAARYEETFIAGIKPNGMGWVMPVWRYSGKEIAEEDVRRASDALSRLCFQCGVGNHREDCPIMILLLQMAVLSRGD